MKLYLVRNMTAVGLFEDDHPESERPIDTSGEVVFVTDTYAKARRFVEQNVDKVPENFIGGAVDGASYGYYFFGLAIEEVDLDTPLGASAIGRWTFDEKQSSRPVVSRLLDDEDDVQFFELPPELEFAELFPAETNRPKKADSEPAEEDGDDDNPFAALDDEDGNNDEDDETIAEPERT